MYKFPKYQAPDFSEARFVNSPDAEVKKVAAAGIAPDNYHATSMYPEYFKINGKWTLLEQTRMDCVPVIHDDGTVEAKEFRRLEVGENAVVGRVDDGSQGIYLHNSGFAAPESNTDAFAFRSGRSRETSFQQDYEALVNLLNHDKESGYIVWVLGPASVFSSDARNAIEYIINNGYAHVILGGNAVVTHDLEGALYNTALGQDIDTRENVRNGHYNHLDAINEINKVGSIEGAVKELGLDNGVIHACVKNEIPFVFAGSIRDDGPMKGVINDMHVVQDAMRVHTKKATTVVCLATQLHMIATGNLTPSYTVTNGEVSEEADSGS